MMGLKNNQGLKIALMACFVVLGMRVAIAADFGRCEVQDNVSFHALTPGVEKTLVIAVPLPSPQAYQGNRPEEIDGGYLYCLAAEIAHRGGLERVSVKHASFEALITGKGSDFDMSIWDLFPTEERKKSVDFSDGYRFTDSGVIVKSTAQIDENNIRQQTIGVLIGSLQERFVRENLQPEKDLRIFQSNDDMWAALMANQIDAAFADTETALPRATASNGVLKVVGRYPVGGDVAILFPKGSVNVVATNQILADMRADGSLKVIEEKWFAPILGQPVDTIALWHAP